MHQGLQKLFETCEIPAPYYLADYTILVYFIIRIICTTILILVLSLLVAKRRTLKRTVDLSVCQAGMLVVQY